MGDEALRLIDVSELKVGMYVILPLSWFRHPFLRGQFVIKSEGEIAEIRRLKIERLTIDPSKGEDVGQQLASISHPDRPGEPPATWEPEKLLPEGFRAVIRDPAIEPARKADAVYRMSVTLLDRLMGDPKAENIGVAKEGLREVVDLILQDDETARNLSRITTHDFYTYTHSVNVGILAVLLAKELFAGNRAHDLRELGASFFLHDLGKTRVDPAIINKPGRLDLDEMRQMRRHPYQGYKLLRDAGQLTEECAVIVMQHHERDDGNGYPRRLSGNEIHDYGRIGCIADVYDAITAERSYKPGKTPFQALTIMKEEMIRHFHRGIFEEFVQLFRGAGTPKRHLSIPGVPPAGTPPSGPPAAGAAPVKPA